MRFSRMKTLHFDLNFTKVCSWGFKWRWIDNGLALNRPQVITYPGWISNEITYPFPNFQRCIPWSLGMDKSFHPTHHWACDYLSTLGLKLIHVPSSLSYKTHFHRQLNCWSLRYSWSIACRRWPTISSFSTQHLASTDWVKTITRWDEKHLSSEIWWVLY